MTDDEAVPTTFCQHNWKFVYTDETWWGSDVDDVFKCEPRRGEYVQVYECEHCGNRRRQRGQR
jgi:hypothetical protein